MSWNARLFKVQNIWLPASSNVFLFHSRINNSSLLGDVLVVGAFGEGTVSEEGEERSYFFLSMRQLGIKLVDQFSPFQRLLELSL